MRNHVSTKEKKRYVCYIEVTYKKILWQYHGVLVLHGTIIHKMKLNYTVHLQYSGIYKIL